MLALTGFMGGLLFAPTATALLVGPGAVFLQMSTLGLAVAALAAMPSAGLYAFIPEPVTSLLCLFGFGSSDDRTLTRSTP